jgi:uncharacterized protein YkwD
MLALTLGSAVVIVASITRSGATSSLQEIAAVEGPALPAPAEFVVKEAAVATATAPEAPLLSALLLQLTPTVLPQAAVPEATPAPAPAVIDLPAFVPAEATATLEPTARPRATATPRVRPTSSATRAATATKAPLTPTPRPVTVALTQQERWMFEEHNEERAREDIEGLVLDAKLVALARERARDMADRQYFSHVAPNGDTALTLMADANIDYGAAGENIVANAELPPRPSVAKAMDDLMDSPGHRNNILRERFTRVGIGVAYDEDSEKYYYCIIFAGP